jgi:hypothetical protein
VVLDAIAGAAANDLTVASSEHGMILQFISTRFDDLYWWFTIIITLLFASFAFTAGSYIYTYVISQRLDNIIKNHFTHLQAAVRKLNKKAGLPNSGIGEDAP